MRRSIRPSTGAAVAVRRLAAHKRFSVTVSHRNLPDVTRVAYWTFVPARGHGGPRLGHVRRGTLAGFPCPIRLPASVGEALPVVGRGAAGHGRDRMRHGAEPGTLRPQSPDMILAPDAETICIVPWYREPTAQVICSGRVGRWAVHCHRVAPGLCTSVPHAESYQFRHAEVQTDIF